MTERFRIGLPETAFPFIPSADKFLEYLGRPGGLAGMINELGARLNQPLPDPKTVRKAVKEGVTLRSGEKIKEALASVLTPEMHDYITSPYLAPWMESSLNTNGLAWLCMSKGEHLRIFQTDYPETFTEQFLKRRAEQEMELFQAGLDIQKSDASATLFEEQWRGVLKVFLRNNTRVDCSHIDTGLRAAATLKSNTGQSRRKQAGLLLGLYTRLRVDFYYHLLCNVSLDLTRWFNEQNTVNDHDRQWLVEQSFFGDMVPAFDGSALTLPFERLLDTWRRNAIQDQRIVSWAKIAECLPNPYGLDADKSRASYQTVEAREEEIRKNKKSRLREWRNGTRPDPEQLKQFIRNLVPEDTVDKDVSLATMQANVAVIWGAFVLDEWAVFEKCGLHGALRDTLPAFGLFPVYWADFQSQAARILTA